MKTLNKQVVKRTYNLPAETLAKFEEVVPVDERGAAVNEATNNCKTTGKLANSIC